MDQQSSTLSYKSINFINTVETTNNDRGSCHAEWIWAADPEELTETGEAETQSWPWSRNHGTQTIHKPIGCFWPGLFLKPSRLFADRRDNKVQSCRANSYSMKQICYIKTKSVICLERIFFLFKYKCFGEYKNSIILHIWCVIVTQ